MRFRSGVKNPFREMDFSRNGIISMTTGFQLSYYKLKISLSTSSSQTNKFWVPQTVWVYIAIQSFRPITDEYCLLEAYPENRQFTCFPMCILDLQKLNKKKEKLLFDCRNEKKSYKKSYKNKIYNIKSIAIIFALF